MPAEEADAGETQRVDAQKLTRHQDQIKSLRGSLKVDTSDLKSETQQIKKLQAQYARDKAAAQQKDASLQDQLNAPQSTAALAQQCAAVMATGLVRIYVTPHANAAVTHKGWRY